MDEPALEQGIIEPASGKSDTPHLHEQQKNVVQRLARIEGHIRAIKRMVEEDTPCPDVLIQIAAVRAALNGVGRLILEDHLQHCMVNAIKDGDYHQAMRDLKNSLDRLLK